MVVNRTQNTRSALSAAAYSYIDTECRALGQKSVAVLPSR